MDAVAALLDGSRARGAFLLRSSLEPPFALRIEDEAPLTVLAVLRGRVRLDVPGLPPHELGDGDVAVVPGPAPYTVGDDRGTSPTARIGPGQTCTTLAGEPLTVMYGRGVRTWGNAPDGAVQLLTGTYPDPGDVPRRVLRALPPAVVVRAADHDAPFAGLLADELTKDRPGQEAVLDRLLDLLLVATLRAWFDDDAHAPRWYRAYADPVVGHALRLLHGDPARPWTVAVLAAEAGISRAALAARFTELVGEPPMGYLAAWRVSLAADLLADPALTLAAVAARVGYGSPYALSTAFKRLRGVSPQRYRAGLDEQ